MSYDGQFWSAELKRYKEDYQNFTKAGRDLVKRFRDERKDSENADTRFNIFWSNIKTLKPAVYSRAPKVEVSRRFKDENDVARTASSILERVIAYELRQYTDYHSALSNSVDDRLIVGRGVAWIRYEPKIETIEESTLTDDVEIGDYSEEPLEKITDERTPVDYVFWDDFAHTPGRTWEEVTWVARRVYLTKAEGVERFKDAFLDVPLTNVPNKDGENTERKDSDTLKKAPVWEIWCKTSKKVYWLAESNDSLLDVRDDPLNLEQFFPCPKPIYATTTTNTLLPVADFRIYQDQANEIDDITARIKHLTRALKVQGIYAADETAIERLLKEGNDAVMIPVKNWQAFVEKGGLGSAVQFMPLGEIIQALQQLYQARESCKQIIYEITGISDILRGSSIASETATAQQIKSQYAGIRLGEMKDDVARFARELLRMKAEIICSKYQPDILLTVSGIAYTPDGKDPDVIAQAIALLKNETARNFQIDIQTDTLVELDEAGEKQARIEFLTAAGGFLDKAVKAGQSAPELQPLLMSMLLFGVRGFKVGRELEKDFEQAMEQLRQKAQNPPQPQPNPEEMKIQADQQKFQQEMQLKFNEFQQELQMEMQKHKMTLDAEIAKQRMKLEADILMSRERNLGV